MLFSLVLCAAVPASAQDEWPEKTHDGLELQHDTEGAVVYWRPDATLEGYSKVYLVDAAVAFHKNWKGDMSSRSARGASGRITSTDMESIKSTLADEFRAIFVDELENNGGFEIVDELGEDVLLIKPAIVNLYITAPDIRNTQRSGAMIRSAGEMTLYLEFYDGYTGQIFGRVLDRQVDDKGDIMISANRVTNKRDADKMLRSWAVQLREHMTGLN
jgi:hypothetical protein